MAQFFKKHLSTFVKGKQTKAFGIYIGSAVFAKILPFFVLPIVTALLGPEEYGKWALFTALMTFGTPLTGGTMGAQLSRRFYLDHTPEERRAVIQQTFLMILAFSLLIFLLFLPLLFWDEVLSLPTQILLFMPAILCFQNIADLVTKLFRFEERPLLFALFDSGQKLLMVVFYTALILYAHTGWIGFVTGSLAATALFAIFSIIVLYKKYGLTELKPDVPHIKMIIDIGLPMIPHSIGGSLIMMIDRIAIEKLISIEAVGIYAMGITIAGLQKIFATAYIQAWAPWLTKQLSHLDDKAARRIVKNTYLSVLLFACVGVANGIAGWLYMDWFIDERFHPALSVIPWAILAFFVQGIYKVLSHHIIFEGKTKVLMFSTFSVGFLNLILTILFIHWFGMIGAIQATALSYTLQLTIVFLYIQRQSKIAFFHGKLKQEGKFH